MKLFLLLFIVFNSFVLSSEIVQVKISKIHGLVSFVHSLSDLPYSVKSYKTIYLEKHSKKSLIELKKNTQKIYKTKVYSFIKQQSSFVSSIKDLKKKVLKDRRFKDTQDLKSYFLSLEKFLSIYEKLIFNDNYEKLKKVKKQIQVLMTKSNYDTLIQKAALFYGIKKADIPLIYLSLYPITRGKNTLAFMLENVESIGVLVHKKKPNLHWLLSATIFHEIVHTFYKQNYDEIKHYLYANKFIKYKDQKVFNESLATAFGAGWAFYQLTTKQSNGRWYNNEVYDKTAKAIYPMLSEYMKKNKKMDKVFVKNTYKFYQKAKQK